MCDISIQTRFKTKTVYKVAYQILGAYYSMFAGMLLNIGQVSKMPLYKGGVHHRFIRYKECPELFNPHMQGRTSGFKTKRAALELVKNTLNVEIPAMSYTVILKIKLGGNIIQGTSAGIGGVSSRYVTYAGTEILSLEEVSHG